MQMAKLTSLKAIRKYCLECVDHSPKQVKLCTAHNCFLYPYRFGKNPRRKGKGGASQETLQKARRKAFEFKKNSRMSKEKLFKFERKTKIGRLIYHENN